MPWPHLVYEVCYIIQHFLIFFSGTADLFWTKSFITFDESSPNEDIQKYYNNYCTYQALCPSNEAVGIWLNPLTFSCLAISLWAERPAARKTHTPCVYSLHLQKDFHPVSSIRTDCNWHNKGENFWLKLIIFPKLQKIWTCLEQQIFHLDFLLHNIDGFSMKFVNCKQA